MERLKLCLVVAVIALAAPLYAENQCGFSGFSHPLDQTGGQIYKLSRGMLASAIIHLGDDFIAPEKTPVKAIADGKIVRYQASDGYGELVCVIEHDLGTPHLFTNSRGQTVSTRYLLSIYGHIRKSQERGGTPLPWSIGDCVSRGNIIGYINNSSHPLDLVPPDPNGIGGEHLHLGVRLMSAQEAQNRDPGYWFRGFAYATGFEVDFADPMKVIQSNLIPYIAIGQLADGTINQKFVDMANEISTAYRIPLSSITAYDNGGGAYVHQWEHFGTVYTVQDVLVKNAGLTHEKVLFVLGHDGHSERVMWVKEGFYWLFMRYNTGILVDNETWSGDGTNIYQTFSETIARWYPSSGKLKLISRSDNTTVIAEYSNPVFTIAGTGEDDTYTLGGTTPTPDPVIPITDAKLGIQPAEPGFKYQLARGQKSIDFSLQISHTGGNEPKAYRFYNGDALLYQGANQSISALLGAGNHLIRARIEAGSGNALQVQEVSQVIVIETAPKSDWGVPFEVKVNTIAAGGAYIHIAGAWISGPNAGKGFLRRVLISNPEQGESYTFPHSFNKLLLRDSYLFAATSNGLMISQNQGSTWSTLYSNGEAYDIAILPGDKFNDWPIMILVGSAGGNSVVRGFWFPSEPNSLNNMLGMGGLGPYTLVGGRISREEVSVTGSGQNGIQTRKGPYHLAYTNSDGRLEVDGRAYMIFTSDNELLVALKTNGRKGSGGKDLGDNVYYNDEYGGSSYKKARGIGPGDDVVAFAWIDGIPGPAAITRQGVLYHAPSDRTQWRKINGFAETVALDLASGQTVNTMSAVRQNALIGTERGLRVLPAKNITALAAAAKPVVTTDEDTTLSAPVSSLLENYPNPFNPVTTIRFQLLTAQPVKLRVYDIRGALVSELVNETLPAGVHTVNWEGARYASGLYLCVLETKRTAADSQAHVAQITRQRGRE